MAPSDKKVLEVLESEPQPISFVRLWNKTGFLPETIGNAIGRLREAGKVEEIVIRGELRYRLKNAQNN